MQVRSYGQSGPLVILLHGGPGAPGHMAPVARGLADRFRVLEPFQRASGGEPLTVARHVADLRELVESLGAGERPALVGSSWGAMLALAFAAGHSDLAGPLALVGCGTFDVGARARMREILDARMDQELRRRLASLAEEHADPDEELRARARLILPLYSCELASEEQELGDCDARANQETWDDMLRLQREGVYPAAFSAIRGPAILLHGAADPHPGRMILASLKPYIPQLEYREWERCGHYPWLEKAAREEFFAGLIEWLVARRPSPVAR
jgi:pimeloyl-ACP methyl ester carboxylesterase